MFFRQSEGRSEYRAGRGIEKEKIKRDRGPDSHQKVNEDFYFFSSLSLRNNFEN